MAQITTQQCKDFLVDHFNSTGIKTEAGEWKRNAKYKENDMWVRDFSHPTVGSVSLAENNDALEIYQSAPVVSYFKKFTADEVKGAKNLMKQLIKIRQEYGDDDDLYESENWKKYNHALPSQFTFYFPFDAPYEIYHNDTNNVTNGLDSLMTFNTEDSFNVMFNDRNTTDIDLYTSDILKINCLPAYTDFVDEYHLEATTQAPKDLTVKDFMHILFDLGFEYKVGGEYQCLFEKEIKAHIAELKGSINSTPKPKF